MLFNGLTCQTLRMPVRVGENRIVGYVARAACVVLLLAWLRFVIRGRLVLRDSALELARAIQSGKQIFGLGFFLVVIVVLALASVPMLTRAFRRIPSRAFMAGAAVISAVSSYYAQIKLLSGVPQIPDEFGYLLQINTFAHGALAAPSPVATSFFYSSWAMHHNGHWVAMFPPGYSFLATPFAFLGHVNFANPCIGACTTVLVFLVARELFGGAVARVATILWLGSEFRLLNDASWMSHPTAALMGLLVVFCALRGFARPTIGSSRSATYSAVAGAALVYLSFTRPLNAVIVCIALAPIVLPAIARGWRRGLRNLAFAAAAALPLLGVYGIYCHAVTGSATELPQTAYFGAKEEQTDCYRLGFGKTVGDCKVTQGQPFPDGYSVDDAIVNTDRRVTAWSWNIFGSAVLLLLALVPLLICGIGRLEGPAEVAFAAFVPTVQILMYALFFYHGVLPEYGARFLYEAAPYAVMLYAIVPLWLWRIATRRATEESATFGTWGRRALRCIPLCLWLYLHATGAAIGEARFHPKPDARPNSLNGTLDKIIAASPAVHHAIVFETGCCLTPLTLLDPVHIERNDLLFVKDYGPLANRELLRAYPDRKPFTLGRDRLVPYTGPAPAGDVYVEAEHLGADLLTKRVDAFAKHVGESKAAGGAELEVHALKVGGYVEFTVAVPTAGNYSVSVGFVHAPNAGTMRVDIDEHNIGGDIVLNSPSIGVETHASEGPITLAAGNHTIRAAIVHAGASGDSLRGAIDFIQLSPIP